MSQIARLIPSATTVLLKPSETDFEVLLLQRNSKIPTHGGSWVFPGGKCDPQDCLRSSDLETFESLPLETQLEIALNAALREANEEASITPSKDSLRFFSNWITPQTLPKRFNTFFFIGESSHQDIHVDHQEICDYRWLKPSEALQKQADGECTLPPPTFVTLSQLSKYRNSSEAIKALSKNPITYRPKLVMTSTGFHSIYEEDAGYENAQLTLENPVHRLLMKDGQFRYLREI